MHHVPLKTVATATRPEHVTQARDPSTSLSSGLAFLTKLTILTLLAVNGVPRP